MLFSFLHNFSFWWNNNNNKKKSIFNQQPSARELMAGANENDVLHNNAFNLRHSSSIAISR
jgi:hypothetical protein